MSGETKVGCLAALAGLDLMTSARLRLLLAHHDPVEAFAVAAGRTRAATPLDRALDARVRAAWQRSAARRDPAQWAARCTAAGVRVHAANDAEFPEPLRLDPDPPAVLFVRGDLGALDARRVAIVGTRNATRAGREIAAELGLELAAAGVAVVSGLAKGVDGAAHHGALRSGPGRPVGVAGNGLDRPYPRAHGALWSAVAQHGLLISEWPPGTAPEPFRFPQRNRIIAALSEVVVVVESRARGGSLITAVAAMERGVGVMAVPGSPRSRAADGTNALLADGAAPVIDAADVLTALGLDTRRAGPQSFDPRPAPRGLEADVLACCRQNACTLDDVVTELRVSLSEAAMAVARLERAGWVREAGGWFEPVGRWSALP